MSFSDFSDLPRSHFTFDTSRRYRGLSYNCSHAPPLRIARAPPRRDSGAASTPKATKSRTRVAPRGRGSAREDCESQQGRQIDRRRGLFNARDAGSVMDESRPAQDVGGERREGA